MIPLFFFLTGKPSSDDLEPVIEDSLTSVPTASTNGSTENGSAVAAVQQGKVSFYKSPAGRITKMV